MALMSPAYYSRKISGHLLKMLSDKNLEYCTEGAHIYIFMEIKTYDGNAVIFNVQNEHEIQPYMNRIQNKCTLTPTLSTIY